MTQIPSDRVSIQILDRLATNLRLLLDLDQSNIDTISAAEVERQTGIHAAQFRNDRVPKQTLDRLATYVRLLIDLDQSNVETISSADVERQTGISTSQYRKDLAYIKDLSYFGEFGKPGAAYNVGELLTRIIRILKKVPKPTLERLATYLRLLIDLDQSNVDTISSADVERQTDINAAQFRKDLSYFGEFGKPGVGYNVSELQTRIARILKIDREQRVVLVGAGNLGSALVGYPGLQEHHFNLVAVFDNNFGKIGRPLWNLEILDVENIKELNRELGARIAILAVPSVAAQKVADLLVDAGIDAILNFAPVLLRVPSRIFVRNVSFVQELAVLSYHLTGDMLTDIPTDISTDISDGSTDLQIADEHDELENEHSKSSHSAKISRANGFEPDDYTGDKLSKQANADVTR